METKLENPCPLFLTFSLEFLLCFSMRVSISAILMHAIFFHLLVCFVSSVFFYRLSLCWFAYIGQGSVFRKEWSWLDVSKNLVENHFKPGPVSYCLSLHF